MCENAFKATEKFQKFYFVSVRWGKLRIVSQFVIFNRINSICEQRLIANVMFLKGGNNISLVLFDDELRCMIFTRLNFRKVLQEASNPLMTTP